MAEYVYECQVCGARILRGQPLEQDEPCTYCGCVGSLELYRPQRKKNSEWIEELILEIEGKRGQVVWR